MLTVEKVQQEKGKRKKQTRDTDCVKMLVQDLKKRSIMSLFSMFCVPVSGILYIFRVFKESLQAPLAPYSSGAYVDRRWMDIVTSFMSSRVREIIREVLNTLSQQRLKEVGNAGWQKKK